MTVSVWTAPPVLTVVTLTVSKLNDPRLKARGSDYGSSRSSRRRSTCVVSPSPSWRGAGVRATSPNLPSSPNPFSRREKGRRENEKRRTCDRLAEHPSPKGEGFTDPRRVTLTIASSRQYTERVVRGTQEL